MKPEVLFVVCVGGTIAFFSIALSRRGDLLEPVTGLVAAYFLFFVLRPVTILLGGTNPLALTDAEVTKVAMIGSLGMLGFLTGYCSRVTRVLAHKIPFPALRNLTGLYAILLLYIAVALSSVGVIIKGVGWENIRKSSIVVAYALKAGGGYVNAGLRMGVVSFLILLALRWFDQRREVPWTGLLITAGAIAVFIATISGLRGVLTSLILSSGILWLYSKASRYSSTFFLTQQGMVFLLMAPFTAIFVLVWLNLFRHGITNWRLALDAQVWWAQLQAVLMPFDWACYFMREVPSLLFIHYFYALGLGIIPRQLWPDKPIISVSYYLTDQYIGDPRLVPTYTTTMIGELQLQLPYAGPIVGMFIVGALLGTLYEFRYRNKNSPLANMLYALFYVGTLRSFYTTFQTWLFELILAHTIILIPIIFASAKWRIIKKGG